MVQNPAGKISGGPKTCRKRIERPIILLEKIRRLKYLPEKVKRPGIPSKKFGDPKPCREKIGLPKTIWKKSGVPKAVEKKIERPIILSGKIRRLKNLPENVKRPGILAKKNRAIHPAKKIEVTTHLGKTSGGPYNPVGKNRLAQKMFKKIRLLKNLPEKVERARNLSKKWGDPKPSREKIFRPEKIPGKYRAAA